jgi:3',5'-cyclic AMP phosphodiesterase CpdA
VAALAREIERSSVDHVVITGDVTNLALEQEFEAVLAMLDEHLRIDPHHVTVVPGNHDLYTRGAQRSRRFSTYFEKYLRSDLPEFAVDVGVGLFPIVKLRGPAAFIGLSSAVPQPPLVAAGKVGRAQLEALDRVLEHPEVKKRTPILALHHPAHNPPSRLKAMMEGLHDATALLKRLDHLPRGLLLHGHLHTRLHRRHGTRHGHIDAIGATSASLHHELPAKMAGFNVYSLDQEGHVHDMAAHVYDPTDDSFRLEAIPRFL